MFCRESGPSDPHSVTNRHCILLTCPYGQPSSDNATELNEQGKDLVGKERGVCVCVKKKQSQYQCV